MEMKIQPTKHRYPYSIVWTPLPFLTWLVPVIGHVGICSSAGVVRDFAGPYTVGEDCMAFGWPTKLWQLDPAACYGTNGWDGAVEAACDIYKGRVHNLFCDNCHSHVATALNLMQYGGRRDWNMVRLFLAFTARCRYVSWPRLLLTWLPFCILVGGIVCLSLLHSRT